MVCIRLGHLSRPRGTSRGHQFASVGGTLNILLTDQLYLDEKVVYWVFTIHREQVRDGW